MISPFFTVGMWLSLVEHSVRDAGVGSSNLLIPTSINKGFSLFYLKGVTPPEIATTDIYKGIIPFVIIQIIGIAIICLFPGTVTWLL